MVNIMVTGATGALGTAVLEALISNGVRKDSLYAMARDMSNTSHLKALGVNIVYGDYDDHNSMLGAFAGIDKLLFVSSTGTRDRGGQHKQVVKAAKRSGIQHIVYTSQLHRTDRKDSPIKFLVNSHLDTENAIKKSGMHYTILRNGLYMDLLPAFLGNKVMENGIFLPAGSGKIGFALRSEIAEAAASALISNSHHNKTYYLAGNAVSFVEVAEILYEISGRNITYLNANYDRYVDTQSKIMPRNAVLMLAAFAAAAAQGELEAESTQLEFLLGRAPLSVREFLQKHYADISAQDDTVTPVDAAK